MTCNRAIKEKKMKERKLNSQVDYMLDYNFIVN